MICLNKEVFGTLLVLCTAVISGFAIPINKIFVVGIDPTVFTAIRALMIGAVFFFIASFQSGFDYSRFKKVSWKYLLIIGIVGGGLAFLLYFTGLKLTTAGRAAFLHKTLPLWITIFAYVFLKEKVTRKQAVALGVMFAGTVMLLSAKINPAELWLDPSLGDILALTATVLWGVENVVARYAMINKESNFVVSFARMFIGSLFLFSAVLLLGKIDVLFSLTFEQIRNILISTLILFGYVLTWYWGIRYINVSKASTLLLISPVISLILGIIWFSEPAPILQLIGSALILIGAAFVVKIKSEFITGV